MKITPKVTIRQVDKGLDELTRVLAQIRKGDSYTRAGVIGKKAAAKHDADGGLSTGELAAVHEYGRGNVPERSFVRSSYAAGKQHYIQELRKNLKAFYEGKLGIQIALGRVGAVMASDMRNGITIGAGIPPPNAPSTIAAKGSSRPLVDTGRLVGSISWDVVISGAEKGEGT